MSDEDTLSFAEAAGSYVCKCYACGTTSIIDLKEEPEDNLFCPVCGTEQINELDFNR